MRFPENAAGWRQLAEELDDQARFHRDTAVYDSLSAAARALHDVANTMEIEEQDGEEEAAR